MRIGPILLGFNMKTKLEARSSQGWRELPRHKDEDQVRLDVHRSFIYYPKSKHTFVFQILILMKAQISLKSSWTGEKSSCLI